MITNIAASVHQRLLNQAKATKRPFNEILQYFALERFLYRLSCSTYRDQFILKGALMFSAWQVQFPRPTRDIDLLGYLDNAVTHIVTAIKEICQQQVEEDGLRFDTDSIVGERITKAANYEGVRICFIAYLGSARIPMQIDIGFGDAVVPAPTIVHLPTILDFPPAALQGYTRESVIAEKFQSMVHLGEINSRMKDFFDIWLLASRFDFEETQLAQAIRETFARRHTPIQISPTAFSDAFAKNPRRQQQWIAFLRRYNLEKETTIPTTFPQVIEYLVTFLTPILLTITKEQTLNQHWSPGGPWSRTS